jgi:hypothetical protein
VWWMQFDVSEAESMRWRRYPLVLAIALAICALMFRRPLHAVGAGAKQATGERPFQKTTRDAAAASSFAALVPVLRHPRCMNCHSTGDFPRQGEDGHRHTMNVRRGLNGEGVPGLKCSTCHQDRNLIGEHMPPGATGWRLPSSTMPMIWEGLSDRQLCELFKDPARNGHRTVDQIVQHMSTPLVLWGWHPGEGRAPVPVPESEFLRRVKEWSARGAACPGETASSPPSTE